MGPNIGTGAGYEWKTADKVAVYLEAQEGADLKAQIASAHGHMLDLMGFPADTSLLFLDLGAGAGAVSASVMSRHPRAKGILADMSSPMMQNAAEKLTPFTGRYSYVEYDMNSDEWPASMAGPFEAVVSARAIHHLSDERKGWIFQRAFEALTPGGAFANWDLFRQPDEPQKPEHPTATIEAQLVLLRAAGFVDVSCTHEVGHRAVFFGRKP